MNRFFILLIVFACAPLASGLANSTSSLKNSAITLEDLDANADGVASEQERKSYFKQLELEYQREMTAQEALRLKREKDAAQKDDLAPAPLPAAVPEQKVPNALPKKRAPKKDDKNVTPYLKKKYNWREGEMDAYDANGDGVLEAGELNASIGTKFNSADSNKDGVISQQEAQASLNQFKTNKAKTYGEATVNQQANRLQNRYNNADANDDKKVSKQEYEQYMSKHQQNFDRDGDGIISRDEYRTDGERLPAAYSKKAPKK